MKSADELKLKHATQAYGHKFPQDKNADNASGGSFSDLGEKNASNQSGGTLGEGEGGEHKTPKFIQHCVTAITEKPKTLARVKRKKDGSPFGICTAAYKKNKSTLAAKHSRGEHHTVKQYEGALKKLRNETKELRASRPGRNQIVFVEAVQDVEALRTLSPKNLTRREVRYLAD